MTPVGFGPTQFALVELEPAPLDHSGKGSTAGMTKIVVKTSGNDFSLKSMKTEQALASACRRPNKVEAGEMQTKKAEGRRPKKRRKKK